MPSKENGAHRVVVSKEVLPNTDGRAVVFHTGHDTSTESRSSESGNSRELSKSGYETTANSNVSTKSNHSR